MVYIGTFFLKIAVYDMEGRDRSLCRLIIIMLKKQQSYWRLVLQQALDGKGSAVIGLYTSTDYMGNAIADPQLLVARSIVRAETDEIYRNYDCDSRSGEIWSGYFRSSLHSQQSFTIFYGNKQIAGEKIKKANGKIYREKKAGSCCGMENFMIFSMFGLENFHV